jgi:hypothetical protein
MADDGGRSRHASTDSRVVPLGRRGEHTSVQPAGHGEAPEHRPGPACERTPRRNGQGGDIVVCLGEARVSDEPPADRVPYYVTKYGGLIGRYQWTPESFAADYSVPVRIEISRIRGH